MGTRGPLPKGSQPSKTRFKCPVNNCSSFMRGEKISKHVQENFPASFWKSSSKQGLKFV